MSDHEGDSVDNWEMASLVPTGSTLHRGVESLSRPVIPRATANDTIRALDGIRTQRHNQAQHVSSDYRPRIQMSIGITGRQRGGIPTRVAPEFQLTREFSRNQAYLDFESGQASQGQYELSVVWSVLLSNITPDRRSANSTSKARFHLDEVGQKSNTYIATPELETNRLQIWGLEEDVKQAKATLAILEAYIRSTGTRPSKAKFAPNRAFDGRADSRLELAQDKKHQIEAQRLQLLSDNFPVESYLRWPKDEKMDGFRLRYAAILGALETEFWSRIDLLDGKSSADGIKHVKIGGRDQEVVWKVQTRVLTLIKEYMASSGNFHRLNFFQLPSRDSYRDKISCEKDPITELFLPTMHGQGLPAEDAEWNKLANQAKIHIRKDIRAAVDYSLSALHAAGKHVGMRATFSELGFSQVKSPAGYPEKDYHEFDDFSTMFSEPGTRLESNGLRCPAGKDLSDLVQMLEAMPQFGEPEMHFILHFEVRGRNDSLLRLEKEYKAASQDMETELCATRWLAFDREFDKDTILEISVLDLEHPGSNFQIAMRATSIFTSNPKRDTEKYEFERNIIFKAPKKSIEAAPRRRAVFQGPPGLMTYKEIYAVRFPFKDTDGTFELRRTDIYAEGPSQKSVTPARSSWNAYYYYHEWDTLMGQFGDVKPGHSVSWPMSFESFFRTAKNEGDYRPLPRSFKHFMNEVEEIQGLLSQGINSLPDRKGEQVQNGANGMTVG